VLKHPNKPEHNPVVASSIRLNTSWRVKGATSTYRPIMSRHWIDKLTKHTATHTPSTGLAMPKVINTVNSKIIVEMRAPRLKIFGLSFPLVSSSSVYGF
jgi:type II secretory pathway predicted ATPase ExeA